MSQLSTLLIVNDTEPNCVLIRNFLTVKVLSSISEYQPTPLSASHTSTDKNLDILNVDIYARS